MKKILFLTALSLILGHYASAGCPANAESQLAKRLRLTGKLLLEEKDSTFAVVSEETDRGVRLSKNTEEAKIVIAMAKDRNLEVLSGIFGMVEDGSVMAVVRDKSTCKLKIFGTDGEDSDIRELVPGKLSRTSLEFIQTDVEGIASVRITKIKKSKLVK
jgi:hypothetical protein